MGGAAREEKECLKKPFPDAAQRDSGAPLIRDRSKL
jgi:hypothetical protein